MLLHFIVEVSLQVTIVPVSNKQTLDYLYFEMVNCWLVCICIAMYLISGRWKLWRMFQVLPLLEWAVHFSWFSSKIFVLSVSFWIVIFPVCGSKLCRPQLHPRKGGSRCWTWRVWFPTLVHLIYRELTHAQDPNMTKRSTIKFPRCHIIRPIKLLMQPMRVTCINSM